jgi:hypothetical protein
LPAKISDAELGAELGEGLMKAMNTVSDPSSENLTIDALQDGHMLIKLASPNGSNLIADADFNLQKLTINGIFVREGTLGREDFKQEISLQNVTLDVGEDIEYTYETEFVEVFTSPYTVAYAVPNPYDPTDKRLGELLELAMWDSKGGKYVGAGKGWLPGGYVIAFPYAKRTEIEQEVRIDTPIERWMFTSGLIHAVTYAGGYEYAVADGVVIMGDIFSEEKDMEDVVIESRHMWEFVITSYGNTTTQKVDLLDSAGLLGRFLEALFNLDETGNPTNPPVGGGDPDGTPIGP